jgi:hypothetical protein
MYLACKKISKLAPVSAEKLPMAGGSLAVHHEEIK